MAYRDELQKRIDKKLEEISSLEATIREAKTYLQALQDAMRLLPKENGLEKEMVLRHGSAVAKAKEAIIKAGKPLHISEILKAIGKPDDKSNRVSLSGNIQSYVRKGQVFQKTAPNTFGLVGKEYPEDELGNLLDGFKQDGIPLKQ